MFCSAFGIWKRRSALGAKSKKQMKLYKDSDAFTWFFAPSGPPKIDFPEIWSSIADWVTYLTIPSDIVRDYEWSLQSRNQGVSVRKTIPDNWETLCRQRPIKAVKALGTATMKSELGGDQSRQVELWGRLHGSGPACPDVQLFSANHP